jgi:hypothetical protein
MLDQSESQPNDDLENDMKFWEAVSFDSWVRFEEDMAAEAAELAWQKYLSSDIVEDQC